MHAWCSEDVALYSSMHRSDELVPKGLLHRLLPDGQGTAVEAQVVVESHSGPVVAC